MISKKINDTYGHQAGDAAIRRLAESLGESVRECDYVGRYGGEEFLIVLPSSPIEGGAAIAERIRHNVGRLEISTGGEEFSVTVSIGVSGYPEDGDDMETLLRKADSALYAAKARGRDCIVVSKETEGRTPVIIGENKGPNLKLVTFS